MTDAPTLKPCPFCAQSLETIKEMGRQLDKDGARIANLTAELNTRAAPKVKALKWYEKPKGQDQRIGRCGSIAYSVEFYKGSWGYTRQGTTGLTVSRPGCFIFESEVDAMSGAEEDHERRILDALE